MLSSRSHEGSMTSMFLSRSAMGRGFGRFGADLPSEALELSTTVQAKRGEGLPSLRLFLAGCSRIAARIAHSRTGGSQPRAGQNDLHGSSLVFKSTPPRLGVRSRTRRTDDLFDMLSDDDFQEERLSCPAGPGYRRRDYLDPKINISMHVYRGGR
jgi:hypothetical protein